MRRQYRYSLDRKESKVAGVCSTLGRRFGIDPTFIRIGFVAALIFTSATWTLVTYAALGIWLSVERKRELERGTRKSDFDRMGELTARRPSTHAMVNDLDANDRRLMAIDHHLNTTNDELAREIEALREDK